MTDYAELRAALAAGPTPGPWFCHDTIGYAVGTIARARIAAYAEPAADPGADIRYIAACHPEAIRALLDERDAYRRQAQHETEVAQAAVERVKALESERDALREALEWSAGTLQAACQAGKISENDLARSESEVYTTGEILDMADAALAQEQEEA